MTFAEYKEKIDTALTNPDAALATMDDLYKSLEADLTTKDSLTEEVTSLNSKVKELQETNIKLYLSRGEKVTEPQSEPEEQGTEEAEVDAFFAELQGNTEEV